MDMARNYFKIIFGDDMGSILQFVTAYVLLMGIIMGGPYFIIKTLTSKSSEEKYSTIKAESKLNTQNIYHDLRKYDSLTVLIEKSINRELDVEKNNINKKREILISLQKDFDSIYLTPQQLRILATVLPEREDVSFQDWISSTNQLYNLGVSFIISLFFYYLGHRNKKTTIQRNLKS